MALKVMRNEVDGWDVVREDEDVALSNHPTEKRQSRPQRSARTKSASSDLGDTPVEVDTEHVHEIEDTRTGMKPAFLGGGALLIVIILIAVVAAIIAAATGFGS